jgi:hypothetical protein
VLQKEEATPGVLVMTFKQLLALHFVKVGAGAVLRLTIAVGDKLLSTGKPENHLPKTRLGKRDRVKRA